MPDIEPDSDQKFKADAGKAMPDLFALGFANAIRGVQATMEYGAQKYEPHSWRDVPNAVERYTRAGARHRQERERDWQDMGNAAILRSRDEESGLPHIVHEMFNIMAIFELELAAYAKRTGSGTAKDVLDDILRGMKSPPTDHKRLEPNKIPPLVIDRAAFLGHVEQTESDL